MSLYPFRFERVHFLLQYSVKSCLYPSKMSIRVILYSLPLYRITFVVDVAADGEKAVERMQSAEPGEYDLILTDIRMPHMDGKATLKSIQEKSRHVSTET